MASLKTTGDEPTIPTTSSVEGENVASGPEGSSGPRHCRCPLCGVLIVAQNQEECIEHMSTCSAFSGVHPDGQPTNLEFFNKEKKKPTTASSNTAETTKPKFGPIVGDDLYLMNVKQLKQYIKAAGLEHDDCIEKVELRERAEEASRKLDTGISS